MRPPPDPTKRKKPTPVPGQTGAGSGPAPRRSTTPRSTKTVVDQHKINTPQGDIQTSGGDYGLGAARRYKQTPAYQKDVQRTYAVQTPQQKRILLNAPKPTQEQSIARQYHNRAVERQAYEQRKYREKYGYSDVMTPEDMATLHAFEKHAEAGRGTDALGGFLQGTLTGGAEQYLAKGLGTVATNVARNAFGAIPGASIIDQATGGKAIKGAAGFVGNAARGAIDVPANLIPGTYSIGRDTVEATKNSGLLKGLGVLGYELDQPFINLYQHPGREIYQNPTQTAALLWPLGRVPKQAIGRVGAEARLGGETGTTGVSDIRFGTGLKGGMKQGGSLTGTGYKRPGFIEEPVMGQVPTITRVPSEEPISPAAQKAIGRHQAKEVKREAKASRLSVHGKSSEERKQIANRLDRAAKSSDIASTESIDLARTKIRNLSEKEHLTPSERSLLQEYVNKVADHYGIQRGGAGGLRPSKRERRDSNYRFPEDAPVEKTGGTPNKEPSEIQWFHGTRTQYEGLPTAKGKHAYSDLGVYMTSDPVYAKGYGGGTRAVSTRRGKGFEGYYGTSRDLSKVGQPGSQNNLVPVNDLGIDIHKSSNSALNDAKIREGSAPAIAHRVYFRQGNSFPAQRDSTYAQRRTKEMANQLGIHPETFYGHGTTRDNKILKEALLSRGYDSIQYSNDHYLALHPAGVEATGGTFPKVDYRPFGRVVPMRVDAKKTLEWRAGRENPAELRSVIEALVARGDKVKAHEYPYLSKSPEDAGSIFTFEKHMHHWIDRLKQNEKSGKHFTPEEMKDLQDDLSSFSIDVNYAEKNVNPQTASHSEEVSALNTGNTPLREVLQSLGYDSIRKVDVGSDALVVLDESIMSKEQGAATGVPGIRPTTKLVEGTKEAQVGTKKRFGIKTVTPQVTQMDKHGIERRVDENFHEATEREISPWYTLGEEFSHKEMEGGQPTSVPVYFDEPPTPAELRSISKQNGGETFMGIRMGTGPDAPWVAVPQVAFERMKAHARKFKDTPTFVKGTSKLFRTGVLLGSNHWIPDNVTEATLRTLVKRAGPLDYERAVRTTKSIYEADETAGRVFAARTAYGGHGRLIGRDLTKVTEEYGLDPTEVQIDQPSSQTFGVKSKVAKAANDIAEIPRGIKDIGTGHPIKGIARIYNGFSEFVFSDINGNLETQFQTAIEGHILKKHKIIPNSLRKANRAFIREWGKGMAADMPKLRNLATALGREIDRAYGKYGKLGPNERWVIGNATPFIRWSVNALNFLYRVMPLDHPILTAVAADINLASEDWRKQAGQYYTRDQLLKAKASTPTFLQGSIPGAGGSLLRLSHGTPMGIFEQGVVGTLAQNIIPQYETMIKNGFGMDWKGDDLATDGDAGKAAAIGTSFIEQSVPFLRMGLDIAGVRRPNMAAGQRIPATSGERIRKQIPYTYTQVNKPKSKAGGKTIFSGGEGKKTLFGGSSGSGGKTLFGP